MQTEYNVEATSISFIKTTGTLACDAHIQTPITMQMIKCSEEEVRK